MYNIGDRVEINDGAYKGSRGIITFIGDNNVTVSLDEIELVNIDSIRLYETQNKNLKLMVAPDQISPITEDFLKSENSNSNDILNKNDNFRVGDIVTIKKGCYEGTIGKIKRIFTKKPYGEENVEIEVQKLFINGNQYSSYHENTKPTISIGISYISKISEEKQDEIDLDKMVELGIIAIQSCAELQDAIIKYLLYGRNSINNMNATNIIDIQYKLCELQVVIETLLHKADIDDLDIEQVEYLTLKKSKEIQDKLQLSKDLGCYEKYK